MTMAGRLIRSRKFRSSKEPKEPKETKEAKETKEPELPKSPGYSETKENYNLHPSAPNAPEHSNSPHTPKSARPLSQIHRHSVIASSPNASPAPSTIRNKLHPEPPSPHPSPSLSTRTAPRMVATIRTVSSFEGVLSDTSSDTPSVGTKNSAFSSSTNSNTSAVSTVNASHTEEDKMSTVRLKHDQSRNWDSVENGDTDSRLPRETMEQRQAVGRQQQQQVPVQQQQQQQQQRTEPNGTEEYRRFPSPAVTRTLDGFDIHVTSPTAGVNEPQPSQAWDSTIGKAGLGKTGRVINKLVSDNEALKRDIKIERLKAEEARQAAKLTEDKMERLIQDYESRLLEANVTKTLLSRKERQVETLTATVELERKRATTALERERIWRAEMETAQHDAKGRVEEATTQAQLMDSRYNAIASHWKDQGEEVHRAASKLRGEISTVVEERRKDDEKIMRLKELCDQQDSSIKGLIHQKEEIARQFVAYKQGQEDWLRDVKTNAGTREMEQERLLEETRATLGKLKWALNVKDNVRGAQ